MRAKPRRVGYILLLSLMGLLVLGSVLTALATPVAFNLPWWTVDGGGGMSSNGSYTLHGTVGQVDAGSPLSSGSSSLQGGFWARAVSIVYEVFLPLVQR